jgi:uncharacterized BrkB/YihY/UPF0761 family membrane protein
MNNYSKRNKRMSRYQKHMENRFKQNLNDKKYNTALFSLVSLLTLFSILIASLAVFGINSEYIIKGYSSLFEPWVFGLSRVEYIVICLFILLFLMIFLRLNKKDQ